MGILKIFTYPFQTWERPIALTFLCTPIYMICFAIDAGPSMLIGGLLLIISTTLIVLSFIILLIKGQFMKAFYTFIFIITLVIIFGLLAS